MRAHRPAAAVLFGVATLTGVLLVGSPARSAPADASLTVSPNHGRANTTFTAQYRFTVSVTGARVTCPGVQFTWDGTPLGLPVRSARQSGGTACVATLRARPPERDRAAGAHQVGVPAVLGHKAAAAGYTIDGATTRGASPTPAAHRDTGTPQADPVAPPLDLPTDPAGPVVAPSASVLGAAGPSAKGGGSAGPLIMVFGGVLVLGGVGALSMLIFRERLFRGRRDAPELGFDPDPGSMYE